MARSRIDPDSPTKSEVISVRLARVDYQRVQRLARAEDRALTTQARKLIREALDAREARAETRHDAA